MSELTLVRSAGLSLAFFAQPAVEVARPGRRDPVTGACSGHRLDMRPFRLLPREAAPALAATPRIGISKATELRWRFADARSPFVSGRRRALRGRVA